jgi:hypothetical protein
MMKACAMAMLLALLLGCAGQGHPDIGRESVIPPDAVKMLPADDAYPPILHSEDYEEPVPLAYPVNTAGAEDSAFYHDGLYLFFTPDVDVPVEKQVIDGVTGIYFSRYANGSFQEPERVWLQDSGKLSLDGCGFVHGDEMWFCSAREGYTGVHLFTAESKDGGWSGWEIADGILEDYEVGEMHLYKDELYFHSHREGGKGGTDIWMTDRGGGDWQQPVNIDAVNTQEDEGYPFITADGLELWFTRWYQGTPGIFRSERVNGAWQKPELILSQFAGEPTLDPEGNIYFTHHFYENGSMIEADIYVAYRK